MELSCTNRVRCVDIYGKRNCCGKFQKVLHQARVFKPHWKADIFHIFTTILCTCAQRICACTNVSCALGSNRECHCFTEVELLVRHCYAK